MNNVEKFNSLVDNSNSTPIPNTTRQKNHNPFSFVISFMFQPPTLNWGM
jgi:hypothetical protein